MMINLEEFKRKDKFITVLDDEGMITVQMSVDSVNKIIDVFDKHITGINDHKEGVNITEFGDTIRLDLDLKSSPDEFTLTGSVSGSHFHDFELEYCNIETWQKIKKLCK